VIKPNILVYTIAFSLVFIITLFHYYYDTSNSSENIAVIKEDAWVAGSIVKSRQNGLLSGIIFTKMFVHKKQKKKVLDYKFNIECYKKNLKVDSKKGGWHTYKSALRSSSSFFVTLDYFLYKVFNSTDNLWLFKLLLCLLFSAVISTLILWVYLEFGLIPALLLTISLAFTPALMQNVLLPLRSLWIRFLPFVIGLWVLRREEQTGKKASTLLILCYAFITIFLAQSRSYEQTSIILISATLPFFYYGIKNAWPVSHFFKRFALVSAISLISFSSVLTLHYVSLSQLMGSGTKAKEYFEYSFLKRSHGSENTVKKVRPRIKKCLNAPTSDVLKDYVVSKAIIWKLSVASLLIISFTLSLVVLFFKLRTQLIEYTRWRQLISLWAIVVLAFLGVN